MTGTHASAEVRFWRQVKKTPSCWEWVGGGRTRAGYGLLRIGPSRMETSHRFSWELHFGPIPNGKGYHGTCVLHRCDNPACVNPKHLFLGTHDENMEDCRRKGRRPHMRGAKNGGAKINEDIVRKIRLETRPDRVVARDYGIGKSMIWNIRNGRNWSHVT